MDVSTSGPTMTFDFQDLPPPAPLGVVATGGELSVSLWWSPVTVADLDYYEVERDTTDQFGGGTVAFITTETAHVDGPLVAGTEYFYRVYAVDLGGLGSDPSETVSATPLADVAPTPPVELEALGGDGAIPLIWPANPEVDIAGYHIERAATPAFTESENLGFVSEAGYTDTTCPLGTGHWYRVVAEDQTGNLSGASDIVAGVAASGDAVYVDETNPSGQNGSYSNPFRQIDDAVAAADPGDVVIVYPGTYEGGFALKDEVSLVGMRGVDATSILGMVSAIGIGGDTVLKAVLIDGGGVAALALDSFGSDFVVEDCELRNGTSSAMACNEGVPVVRRNVFAGSQTGLSCSGAASPILTSNRFEQNSLAHIFTSSSVGPVVGGSLDTANDFVDRGAFLILNGAPVTVSAEYNYWGADCVEASWFSGLVDYLPWTDATHIAVMNDCGSGIEDGETPLVAYAGPSFPNPFRSGTTIAFGMPSPGGAATLRVYSAAGKLVRTLVDETLPAGRHVAVWDGRDAGGAPVSAGVYFYRLEAEGFEARGKTAVLR